MVLGGGEEFSQDPPLVSVARDFFRLPQGGLSSGVCRYGGVLTVCFSVRTLLLLFNIKGRSPAGSFKKNCSSTKSGCRNCPSANKRSRDRNWRPEGGEWEPIKISLEIDLSAYIPKITTNPRIYDKRIAMD